METAWYGGIRGKGPQTYRTLVGVISVLPPRRYDAAAVVAVLYNYCLFVFGGGLG